MTKSVSSSADDLESLNNIDLRALCVEHGLPNVPITDTSRKLLIKRLRVAMEGGAGDSKTTGAKSKARRETFHVATKVTETEQDASPKKSRETRGVSTRRTIGAASEPEEEPTVEVTVRQVTNRRRSRATPVPATKPAPAAEKRKSSVLIEDDEDDDDVQFVENNRIFSRESRSPSLAKSKMVTTSYQHVISGESIPEQSAYKARETIIPIRRETNYDSVQPVVRTQEREIISSAYASRPSSQLSRPAISTSNSGYTTSSTTKRYTTAYKPQTEYISSSSTYKPQIYTSPNMAYRPLSSTTYSHEDENSEDDEEEEDGSPVEAPFLSEFARRLSRLKAEPLGPAVTSVEKEAPRYRESQRFYTTTMIAGRRGINPRGSLGESFRNLWVALDRQYGMRKYLAVIAITLVILFIYIMLVQN